MSLTTGEFPALWNGVSQQPDTIRSVTQLSESVNCWPSISNGLMDRAPSVHVARMTPDILDGAYLHTINRDTDHRYTVAISNGAIRVFDLDGNEKVVDMKVPADYLHTTNPRKSFNAVTIADFTFIINRDVTVELAPMGADLSPQSSFLIDPTTGKPLTISANPPYSTYRGEVATHADLPKPTGVVNWDMYKVTGEGANKFLGYYVIWRNGQWEEAVRNGLFNKFNERTMPHCLVRTASGNFEFVTFAWEMRRVGDVVTNPYPSFVGRKISDVFFHKNRLGFLADESVMLSAAGDYGRFWRATATAILADDPVDASVTTTSVSLLNFAVPFNRTMMMFSDQTQFQFSSQGGLTPSTVGVDPVTNYECSKVCRPVALGSDVYFQSDSNSHSTIREYFVSTETQQTDAADITAHCPKYIPSGAAQMAANTNHDTLVVLCDSAPHNLYVYKHYWRGDEKVQSAWQRWDFSTDRRILSASFIGSKLSMITACNDGTFIESINLEEDATLFGMDRPVFLDRQFSITGYYIPASDSTEFHLPFPVPQDSFRIVLGNAFSDQQGALLEPTLYTFNDERDVVTVPGNYSAGPVVCGIAYERWFELSKPFIRNEAGAVTRGRLQIRTITLNFTDTAYFKTHVAPYGRDFATEEVVPAGLADFTGKTVGAQALTLGTPAYHDGSYSFGVYGRNTEATVRVSNNTHVGFKFQSASWEGVYFDRAR